MSPKGSGMTDTQFVTGLARLCVDPVWPHLMAWFRGVSLERVIDGIDTRDWDVIRGEYAAAQKLMLTIENTVAGNKGIIDGRTTKKLADKRRIAFLGFAKNSPRASAESASGAGGLFDGEDATGNAGRSEPERV